MISIFDIFHGPGIPDITPVWSDIVIWYWISLIKLVITVPADALSPNGVGPIAGTMMTTKASYTFYEMFWLLIFLNFCSEGDINQTGHQDPMKSAGTRGVNNGGVWWQWHMDITREL